MQSNNRIGAAMPLQKPKCVRKLLFRIGIKALSGLSSQVPGIHHFPQQGRTTVLLIMIRFIKHVQRPHHRIQPDQICRFQRSHCVTEAFLEYSVDLLRSCDVVLQHKYSLVHEEVRDPVGNETRQIVDYDRLLIQSSKELLQDFKGVFRGVVTPDNLHGWLQVNGVHEVDPDNLSRPFRNAAYPRD